MQCQGNGAADVDVDLCCAFGEEGGCVLGGRGERDLDAGIIDEAIQVGVFLGDFGGEVGYGVAVNVAGVENVICWVGGLALFSRTCCLFGGVPIAPISLTAFCRFDCVLPTSMTCFPSLMRYSAIARPSPPAPPVTIAHLKSSREDIVFVQLSEVESLLIHELREDIVLVWVPTPRKCIDY